MNIQPIYIIFAACNQREHIEFFDGLDITDTQKRLIFYDNAAGLLKIT